MNELTQSHVEKAPLDRDVLHKVQQTETPSLVAEKHRMQRYLIEGVPFEIARKDGSLAGDTARLIDRAAVGASDWLAVNQHAVVGWQRHQHVDVIEAVA